MQNIITIAINAAIDAGREILKIYNLKDFGVEQKADNSPLTKADKAAHELIVSRLEPTEINVLSEESVNHDYENRKDWEKFWIVDPLDGTKEFIKRNGEFTVNIALLDCNVPVVGVIFVPVSGELYFSEIEKGAWKTKIDLNSYTNSSFQQLIEVSTKLPINEHAEKKKFTIVASRSHRNNETNNFIERQEQKRGDIEIISCGSSLKICMVAEGRADIYPRFGPTSEWDIAAGHAITIASGAKIYRADDYADLQYNKKDLLNPWFIVER